MPLHHTNGGRSYPTNNQTARPVARGVSLAHQTKLSKSQRAVIAADIFDGIRRYQPTQCDLATLLGISTTMIVSARRLSPAARQQIMAGLVTLAHYAVPASITLEAAE